MRKQERTTQTEFRRPKELAETLQVANSTVLEWCRKGQIATVRAGKLYRIPVAEYQRILREGISTPEGTS